MASVDITPPPGLPSLGYSIASKHATFRGHRTRLRAHALVVDDGHAEKVALITMDLAWGSALLKWKIAEHLGPTRGITVDRIMLSGTHTHTGPAGYSSAGMYNNSVPLRGAGYDPLLVEFLVDRLVRVVAQADDALQPANVAIGQTVTSGLTRNRSPEAQANPGSAEGCEGRVDPLLTMIRVDRCDGEPIGAYMIFGGHPTVTGPNRDLWHADVFGVACHELRRLILAECPDGTEFVAALANGADGDVSFQWVEQDHSSAVRFGCDLAKQAKVLHERLDPARDLRPPLSIDHRYEEVVLPGAVLANGRTLASRAIFGAASGGGAEDGRTWLHPWLAREGQRAWFESDSHGAKATLLGPLQRLFLSQETAPRIAPIQVIRLGGIYLVSFPFEMTVDAAQGIRQRVQEAAADSGSPVDENDVVIVSLTNDYASYCTTSHEYDAQHYEGGSTLYGPHCAEFLAERAGAMTRGMLLDSKPPPLLPRLFHVGTMSTERYRFPSSQTEGRVTIRDVCDPETAGRTATLCWSGLSRARINIDSGWLVKIQFLDESDSAWKDLVTSEGAEDDLHLSFAVRLLRENTDGAVWEATWYYPEGLEPERWYRFALAARPGVKSAYSTPFQAGLTDAG